MKTDIVDDLFKKYYNEALLYTMALCSSQTTAEDIVQSAFFKALQTSDNEIHSFKAWLLAVCRNEYFTLLRRGKFLSGTEPDENAADLRESALDEIIRQEEYQALYRAIAELRKEQREVIVLFYFSRLSVRQISGITGNSESNVKVLLYRARAALKKEMGEA